MKRKQLIGAIFVTAIAAGLMYIGHVSAQKEDSDAKQARSEPRPESPAAAFTPGNLVICRADGGGAALGANATLVVLDEYTTAGSLVQSVAVPSTVAGARLTITGNSTTECEITRSVDGNYIVIPGYDAAVGALTPATVASSTIPRVIGRVDQSGTFNLTTTTTSFSAQNIRGAATTDGTNFWSVGSGTGLVFTPLGGSGTGTVVASDLTNSRTVGIAGGQLYTSSGSGTLRMNSVGTGTPTTGPQTSTALAGMPTATVSNNGFFFADLSAGVAGVDTAYIADDQSVGAGTIRKYTFNGTTWAATGVAAGNAQYRGLTGSVNGAVVTIYATRAGNELVSMVDSTGYNGTLAATPVSLATAGSNTAFRGVVFAPGSGSGPTTTVPKKFEASLSGASEVPANGSAGIGYGRVVLNAAETQITASVYFSNLGSAANAGHIHGPAAIGVNAGVLFDMSPSSGTSGSGVDRIISVSPAQVADLKAGLWYFNIHSVNLGNGEIRGQIMPAKAPVDFDGDGKTDFAVVRNVGGGQSGQLRWYAANGSGGGSEANWGLATDFRITADFDGDRKSDFAVWRPDTFANFYIIQSATNTIRAEQFGQSGDDPTVVSDYDGDGKADLAVYRAGALAGAQSFWYYRTAPNAGTYFIPWGSNGDFVAPGDIDGDGRADFTIQRGSGGGQGVYWTRLANGTNLPAVFFARATDSIVPGDYDGDGKTDLAVIRGSGTGQIDWFYKPSSAPAEPYRYLGAWGLTATDFTAQGDYDGDGTTDMAVWRPDQSPTQTYFYVNQSTSGFRAFEFGMNGDYPVASFNHH